MVTGLRRGPGPEPVPVRGPVPAQPHETAQRVQPRRRRDLPGERIAANGVGEVVASASGEYKVGDVVVGMLAWEEHTLFHPSTAFVSKVDGSGGFPLSYYVSVLGSSGMTAYGGFYELCKPQRGEKVFVSTAAGSVGNLAGQFAKLAGCYVVGCAGTDTKVELIKNQLGFDEAFNYRDEPNLKSALKRYFPDGIDIYFDNVGGEMLQAAVANMNVRGRVAACGAITEYTGGTTEVEMMDVIYRRIKIQGFAVSDYPDKYNEYMGVIGDWVRQGKVQAVEDISDGLENIPSALLALYRGDNIGKKIVRLY